MEFLDFTVFCGRIESNYLFNLPFINHWINSDFYPYGIDMNDDFNMFCMGGEI